MPVKRNRIKVASPPPIPAPRPAFEESFSQLAPVCRHDFSRHPASFSSLDQRLSIVSLLLRIDEGYGASLLPRILRPRRWSFLLISLCAHRTAQVLPCLQARP